jgi:long-chain acyl-CoA synthetase
VRHNHPMRSPFLHDWVLDHAAATPGAPAIAGLSAALTYADLAERARVAAAALADAGIGRGDRVLVAIPDTPAAVVVAVASSLLGATVLAAPRAWGRETLGGIARATGAAAGVLAERDARPWAGEIAAWGVRMLVEVAARSSGADAPAAAAPMPPGTASGAVSTAPIARVRLAEDGRLLDGAIVDRDVALDGLRAPLDPSDHALIVYTSGSTGRPRGVIQTHANVDANSRSIVEYLGLTAADRAMLTLPLSYCYGRSVLQTHLLAGGSVVLDHRSAFPRTIVDAMAASACTGFAGVPLTFELFRRHLGDVPVRVPSLRYVTQAGGPMSPDTIAWARRAFAPAPLFVMYGQTEATARLAYLPPDDAERKAGSVGIAIPGVELRILDEAGREVPDGIQGELAARGANVTPGYLDEPGATAEILRDGWLLTGDLAVRDADGYLFLAGRAREFLKVGGHRVSPARIEEVLERHPSVAEAGVAGRADGLAGEVPVAAVVAHGGAALDADDLRRYCEPLLARHEIPAAFLVVARLPRNEAGKLLRGELRALVDAPAGGDATPSARRDDTRASGEAQSAP